jgi:HK97 family phage major capsid protein
MDPCGFVVPDIKKAQEIAKARGGKIAFVASVLGTTADWQDIRKQEEELREAGIYVCRTNYSAALLASEIIKLRKTYISAKPLVSVVQTTSLAGSFNFEAGSAAGLIEFEDGDTIGEDSDISFAAKKFAIKWFGKIIPVSRILQGAEKAGLLSYIDDWFVKNAILSENAKIFATLKAGYNAGTPKAVAGWKALKKSINVDLDPACKIDGVIITNQSGFAALDEEEDKDGKPVLQPNPANPTQKLFQGLTVHVFPDAQLPNIDTTHFPMIYGSTKAGCKFIEHQALEFAASEHAGFTKNQNVLRVIEGFDVMSADTTAYIYGSFAATTA